MVVSAPCKLALSDIVSILMGLLFYSIVIRSNAFFWYDAIFFVYYILNFPKKQY